MRLHNLRLREITETFPNDVCVDFDSLGEGLIAIVGEQVARPAVQGPRLFDLRVVGRTRQ